MSHHLILSTDNINKALDLSRALHLSILVTEKKNVFCMADFCWLANFAWHTTRVVDSRLDSSCVLVTRYSTWVSTPVWLGHNISSARYNDSRHNSETLAMTREDSGIWDWWLATRDLRLMTRDSTLDSARGKSNDSRLDLCDLGLDSRLNSHDSCTALDTTDSHW